jgi:hypothetical protein
MAPASWIAGLWLPRHIELLGLALAVEVLEIIRIDFAVDTGIGLRIASSGHCRRRE